MKATLDVRRGCSTQNWHPTDIFNLYYEASASEGEPVHNPNGLIVLVRQDVAWKVQLFLTWVSNFQSNFSLEMVDIVKWRVLSVNMHV